MFTRFKNWFSSEEVKQLKFELDTSDDIINELQKDVGKGLQLYKTVLEEKRVLFEQKNYLEDHNKLLQGDVEKFKNEYNKLKVINEENITKYNLLKKETSSLLDFLDGIGLKIDSEIMNASSTINALVPPK